tara:strand:+ start:320 stop:622 length:303 start_codon:yes stop_codon:yes gene_type:complete
MNAYDIAKDLDREGKFPGHVCYGTSPLLVRAANKLRKQADQITKLEEENMLLRQAMDNAFNGLESSIAMNKAQAERFAELERKHKEEFDYAEKLLKERDK